MTPLAKDSLCYPTSKLNEPSIWRGNKYNGSEQRAYNKRQPNYMYIDKMENNMQRMRIRALTFPLAMMA